MNGGKLFLRSMEEAGVKVVFGVPGETSLPVYHELTDSSMSLRHVLMRDERNSAYAACGYAKASGGIGVVESPSGGGALYVVPGLSEAYNSSIPLLSVTTDLPADQYETGSLTELNQRGLISSVVKHLDYVTRTEHIPASVQRAMTIASSGRPGPSHLILPVNILEHEVSGTDELLATAHHVAFPYTEPRADAGKINEAIGMIISAERPFIVAGGGVHLSGAYDSLKELAELIIAPVGTTLTGKGTFPETNPLSVGVIGENSSRKLANSLFRDADLVIFAGCKLGNVATFGWTLPDRKAKIIHIDVSAEWIGRNFPLNEKVLLLGDANSTLKAMVERLRAALPTAASRSVHSDRVETIRRETKDWWQSQEDVVKVEGAVRPQVLFKIIRQLFKSKDVIISADPGTSTPASASLFPIDPAGRRYMILRSHGALGNGLGMSIGAKIARPDKKVLFFTGDGSLGMSAGEIETTVRARAPLIMFLFQNSSFSWIKAHMRFLYDSMKFASLDFGSSDWVKIAEGHGAKGFTLTEDNIEKELKRTIKDDGTLFYAMNTVPLEEKPPLYWPWLTD